ncbi:MAG: hypothetical protein IPN01_16870 [Deltaproteobacteria bacterium]|nr:hypothetical protein [Deltaproteobacteria bacterium]
MNGPTTAPPTSHEALLALGDGAWSIAAFRELERLIFELRFNHPTLGLLLIETAGDQAQVLAWDEARPASPPRALGSPHRRSASSAARCAAWTTCRARCTPCCAPATPSPVCCLSWPSPPTARSCWPMTTARTAYAWARRTSAASR